MVVFLRVLLKWFVVFLFYLIVFLLNIELVKFLSFWFDEWLLGMGGGDVVLEIDGVGRLCVGEINGVG